jgi:outer membrane protein assembly factor BamB
MRLGLPAALVLAVGSGGLTSPGSPASAADNWPAFRGPNGDGTSDAKNVPTHWSETQNVRWKTPIHGKGWSSPVVWGGQVWVTTADEVDSGKKVDTPRVPGVKGPVEQVTFFAVCLDRKTGQVVHDVKLAVEKDPAYCIPFNSYASCTPCIEEGRVYAHFGSHGTWCVDTATGKVVWERRDLECDHFRGPASSPILYQNLLILIFDGYDRQYVAALDKATGRTVWKTDRDIRYSKDDGDWKKAYSTARVLEIDGRPQLVCPSAEATIAYDPLTGREVWRVIHGGMNTSARVLAGHGLVYLTTGNTQQLWAIRPGGSGVLPKEAVAWRLTRGVPTRSSPVLVGDYLFMVNDGGFAQCVEAKTGKVMWSQERLGGGGAEFSAAPVSANGNVYFCDQIGRTFVVAAKPEFNLVAENRLDVSGAPSPPGFMASPAVAGDNLFVRTRTHLYCIGKE